MSPTTEKVHIIIIIGTGCEGLAAADYIKSNSELKYKIIENSFLGECREDAKGKHGTNLKLKEKVTSAQMDKKMEHWVVMTEKEDGRQGGPRTKTEYKCHGVIIATGNPYNVSEWLKERISFHERNIEDFEVKTIHDLGKYRICSIGFEKDRLYRIKSSLEICSHGFFFGDIIVGAGPAGLATAASFNQTRGGGRKYKIIEKTDCIAPLWRYHTYDKLTLQRPKEQCQLLADKPFPNDCPAYPTRDDFLEYLHDMANKLAVQPQFNEEVTKAYYIDDPSSYPFEYRPDNSHWVVRTIKNTNRDDKCVRSEYKCTGLVVASGRDARPRIPEFKGLKKHFPSLKKQIHASEYKNGKIYKGKKVLVVGYGDSAIDICGDLHNEGAEPHIVVRDSTRSRMAKFCPGKKQKETFPLKLNLSLLSVLVDNFGQCENGVINREENIEIEVYPDIEEFEDGIVKFKNVSNPLPIDCVILATGYNDNVRLWCQEKVSFQKERKELRELELEASIRNRVLRVGFSKDGLLGIKGQTSAAKFGEKSSVDEVMWLANQ